MVSVTGATQTQAVREYFEVCADTLVLHDVDVDVDVYVYVYVYVHVHAHVHVHVHVSVPE